MIMKIDDDEYNDDGDDVDKNAMDMLLEHLACRDNSSITVEKVL